MSLFSDALGPAFDTLPAAIRRFHNMPGPVPYRGQATIARGRHPMARLALWLGGFPPEGAAVPVEVRVEPRQGREVWTRKFGGHVTRSELSYDAPGHIRERFGPITLRIALRAEADALHFRVAGVWLWHIIPLPRLLWPHSTSREVEDAEGRFRFEIAAELPAAGPLIRYQGSLHPATCDTEATSDQPVGPE